MMMQGVVYPNTIKMFAHVNKKSEIRGVSLCIHILYEIYSGIVDISNTLTMYYLRSLYPNNLIM